MALNRFAAPDGLEGSPSTQRVLRVEPDGAAGEYALTATSIVGSIRVHETQVSILPKAGVGKTAFMLGYGLAQANWRREYVHQEAGDLVEALVMPFLDGVDHLVATGLAESYVPTTEDGSRPRGSIDFGAAGVGLPLPVRYKYDAFNSDTPENRLIRSALERILTLGDLSRIGGARATQLLDAFQGIAAATSMDLDPVPPDDGYRRVLGLAKLILDNAGIEPGRGERESQSLLFDMNAVFESFVCSAVKNEFDGPRFIVDQQGIKRPRFLAEGRRLRVRPDFSVWNASKCLLVGDVKYKLLGASLRRADLYQSVAYALATGARVALLIYAGSGPSVEVHVPASGTVVRAVPLDLEIQSDIELLSAIRKSVKDSLTVSLADVS